MARLKGVTAVLVLACLGLFAYGCGNDDSVTQEDIDDAINRVQEKERLRDLQQQVKELRRKAKQGSKNGNAGNRNTGNAGQGDGYYENGSAGGPVSTCATSVQVGPNTSCDFAMNVAGEYGSNPGASSITAYSPVTGEYYTMSCGAWSGGGTVCTGGNGAAVYLP